MSWTFHHLTSSENSFLCRLPSWNMTNHNRRRQSCTGWTGHVQLKQISNNLCGSVLTSHSHQRNRQKKDATRSASTPAPEGGPAVGCSETSVSLRVTELLGLFIYQHFLSPGGALSSACPLVFSLSSPCRHVP